MTLSLLNHVTREIVLHVNTARETLHVIAHCLDHATTIVVISGRDEPLLGTGSQDSRPHARYQSRHQIVVAGSVTSRRLKGKHRDITRGRVIIIQGVLQGHPITRRDVIITTRGGIL